MTDNVVALVNETVFALVTEPSVFIKSTCGIDTKFVPVIVTVVAVAGAMVCDTFATVGLVSCASTQDNWLVLDPLLANTCPLVPVLWGNIKVYDCPAEWGGAFIFTPWEFCEQFNCIWPSALEPSPLTVKVGEGKRSLFIVPAVIFAAFIAATLNVPNATKSNVSPAAAPDAKTTELPDVTVTSVPFTSLTPLR